MDPAAQAALRGSAIMVVEDEYFQAEDLALALSEAGARLVGPFPTVEVALAALAQEDRIDAAVLDVNLRGAAVSPVAEALVARGIPFLFATGYDREMIPTPFHHATICEKPFDSETLIDAVAGLCLRGNSRQTVEGESLSSVDSRYAESL